VAGGRVLLVDDDRALRDAVSRALRLEGYEVAVAAEGREALHLLASRPVDLVVLDVSMPVMNGLEVLSRIRSAREHASVLMLTARDGIPERIAGLDAGADDYLVKPFALAEFLARVRAGVRRQHETGTAQPSPDEPAELAVEDLRIDARAHQAFRASRRLALTKTEYLLLELFMVDAGTVLSRAVILDRIWGGDNSAGTKVVDVFISHLRRKLEAHGEPRLIQTVHGVGYVLRKER
jgi:two-component system, OmpR family, response regulator MprA